MKKFLCMLLISGTVFSQENPEVVIPANEELMKSSCWATLYADKNMSGNKMTIFNGYDLPELEEIQSIEAGTTARVSLYPEENFSGREYILHPSSRMRELPWEEIRSLRLTCVSLEEALKDNKLIK